MPTYGQKLYPSTGIAVCDSTVLKNKRTGSYGLFLTCRKNKEV
jgi:hypothetical protein